MRQTKKGFTSFDRKTFGRKTFGRQIQYKKGLLTNRLLPILTYSLFVNETSFYEFFLFQSREKMNTDLESLEF